MRIVLLPKFDQNTVSYMLQDACCVEILSKKPDGKCLRIAFCKDGRTVAKEHLPEKDYFQTLFRKLWPRDDPQVVSTNFSFDDPSLDRQLQIISEAHLLYFCGFAPDHNHMTSTWIQALTQGGSPVVRKLRERMHADDIIYVGTCGGAMLAGDTITGAAALDLLSGLHVAYESSTAPHALRQRTGNGQILLVSGCGMAVLEQAGSVTSSCFVAVKRSRSKWQPFAFTNAELLQRHCEDWFQATTTSSSSTALPRAAQKTLEWLQPQAMTGSTTTSSSSTALPRAAEAVAPVQIQSVGIHAHAAIAPASPVGSSTALPCPAEGAPPECLQAQAVTSSTTTGESSTALPRARDVLDAISLAADSEENEAISNAAERALVALFPPGRHALHVEASLQELLDFRQLMVCTIASYEDGDHGYTVAQWRNWFEHHEFSDDQMSWVLDRWLDQCRDRMEMHPNVPNDIGAFQAWQQQRYGDTALAECFIKYPALPVNDLLTGWHF